MFLFSFAAELVSEDSEITLFEDSESLRSTEPSIVDSPSVFGLATAILSSKDKSRVASAFTTLTKPLLSRINDKCTLDGPMFFSACSLLNAEMPVILYTEIRGFVPFGSDVRLVTSYSNRQEISWLNLNATVFIFEGTVEPAGYRFVNFVHTSSSTSLEASELLSDEEIELSLTDTPNEDISVITTSFRTRNAVDRLAARNAAPIAIASSPFKCCPTPTPASTKYPSSIFLIRGIRTPPPNNSTLCNWETVKLAIVRAASIGTVTRA
mmetsp:Transcript_77538/g.152152  ORF Transcript_77538/g.152152 Transcript_77538/m.152152 type:complete len:267 (+) Transcript_77538:885-1685(+)